MTKERRTALNRAADDLAHEITGDGIEIDFYKRTITSAQFGVTNVPKYSTRIKCRIYIKRHITAGRWKKLRGEEEQQRSLIGSQ